MSRRPSLLAGLVALALLLAARLVPTPSDAADRWYPCGGERSSIDGDWRDAAQPAIEKSQGWRWVTHADVYRFREGRVLRYTQHWFPPDLGLPRHERIWMWQGTVPTIALDAGWTTGSGSEVTWHRRTGEVLDVMRFDRMSEPCWVCDPRETTRAPWMLVLADLHPTTFDDADTLTRDLRAIASEPAPTPTEIEDRWHRFAARAYLDR